MKQCWRVRLKERKKRVKKDVCITIALALEVFVIPATVVVLKLIGNLKMTHKGEVLEGVHTSHTSYRKRLIQRTQFVDHNK